MGSITIIVTVNPNLEFDLEVACTSSVPHCFLEVVVGDRFSWLSSHLCLPPFFLMVRLRCAGFVGAVWFMTFTTLPLNSTRPSELPPSPDIISEGRRGKPRVKPECGSRRNEGRKDVLPNPRTKGATATAHVGPPGTHPAHCSAPNRVSVGLYHRSYGLSTKIKGKQHGP